jgi:putative ABC transport system permease protein
VIRLAWLTVIGRRALSTVTVLAFALTLLGFLALHSKSETTSASLRGTIRSAWTTPFDLLVRPPGAREPLENTAGLVRPNYATGVHGGITMAQLARIRDTDGVAIAAPLAVVGAVNWPSAYLRPLIAQPGAGPVTVYQITSTTVGDGGLSRYPVDRRYVVVATRGVLDLNQQTLTIPGRPSIRCSFPVNCFAPVVCVAGHCARGQFPSTAQARYYLPLLQPIVVAGIDPRAEQALLGVQRCVRHGRYLASDASPSPTEDPEPAEILPVLASDTAYVGQTLHVTVKAAALGNAIDPAHLRDWHVTARDSRSMQLLYREYLRSGIADYLDPWPIWSAGDVRYRTIDTDHVRARMVRSHPLYDRLNNYLETGLADPVLIPPESEDVWFRPVEEHLDAEAPGEGSRYRSKIWDVVGRYDPSCVIGYDRLAGGTLDTYATPAVELPSGRSMSPSRSLAGYVSSPPLLLTTLSAAAWLADPERFRGQPGKAFISVVRVRVRGTAQPGADAQARLAQTAAAIHERTGLDVDIVKGASTRDIHVDLPAGRFGRPAITVREQWAVKGVAIRFTRATNLEDSILLGIALAGGGLLLAQTAAASVRQRRVPLAVLRAFGYSPWRIAALVEVETVLLGAAAGVLAGLAALVLPAATGARLTTALVAAVLGVAIAAVAGLVPALAASRRTAAAALRGEPRMRRSRRVDGPFRLAVTDLRAGWGGDSAVAVASIALGALLVGVLVLAFGAYSGQLDHTVLGRGLAARVRPFHVVLAVLTLTVGAVSGGQALTLAWVARRQQYGMLRALGWSRGRLVRLAASHAALLAMVASVLAAVPVGVLAATTGATARTTASALAATAGASFVAGVAAAAVPVATALLLGARALLASR